MGFEDVLFPVKSEEQKEDKLDKVILDENKQKEEAERVKKENEDKATAKANEEATKLEEARRKADEVLKKPKEDKAKPVEEEEEEEEDNDLLILEEVDKLRGAKVEVDYGKVDPLSPEGLYLREQAVEKIGADKFEEFIKVEHPRIYQAMLLERQGKDPSELFDDSYVDYSKLKLDKTNEDMVKDVYAHLLAQKGNDDEEIEDAIKGALDKGGLDKLFERTDKLLKQAAKEQVSQIEREEKEAERVQKAKDKDIKTFSDNISNIISKGEINNFTIPEKDRAAFEKEFKNKLYYQEGKFYLREEINPDDLKARMQAEFFKYRKGDIKDIALKEGKTDNVIRLRRRVNNDKEEKVKTDDKPKPVNLMELAFR